MIFALIPVMLVWQTRSLAEMNGIAPGANPGSVLRQDNGELTQYGLKSAGRMGFVILFSAALSVIALVVPFLGQAGQVSHPVRTTMREALSFISRQALLEADNGTFRALLAASSVWPLLAATLLGSACCILVAYVCACYRFRLRGLVFSSVVLLQLLPMLSRYSALEQMLRNLDLRISSIALGLGWALLYILVALLLYRHFSRMLPRLERNRPNYSGVRLFFYYAFPRARLQVIALTALATLGCWGDAFAPFWHMRELGAFSLTEYIWQSFLQ